MWHVHDTRDNTRFAVSKHVSPALHDAIAQHFSGESGDPSDQEVMPSNEIKDTTKVNGKSARDIQAEAQNAVDETGPDTTKINGKSVSAMEREAALARNDSGSGVGSLFSSIVPTAQGSTGTSGVLGGFFKNLGLGNVYDSIAQPFAIGDQPQPGQPGFGQGLIGGQPSVESADEQTKLAEAKSRKEAMDQRLARELPELNAQNARIFNQPTPRDTDVTLKNKPSGGGGIYTGDKELDKAIKEQVDSIQAQATEKGKIGTDLTKAIQDNENQRVATMKQWDDRWNMTQNRAMEMARQIENGQIDPNHWWHEGGVGRQIAGTIGIILGGIGQAFGGGPNQAKQMIDGYINRDIQAQEKNLGKKQSLLGDYLAMGHDIHQARQLARADSLDALAAQQNLVAAKSMGPMAKAIAAQKSGELHQEAFVVRRQTMMQGEDLALKRIQVQEAQQGLVLQQATLKALGALAGGGGGGGQGGGVGVRLDPTAEAILSQGPIGSRMVRLPSGNTALAKDPEDSKKIKDVLEKVGHYRDLIGQMRQLHAAHPNGISQIMSPEDYGKALRLQNEVIETGGELENLTRFTGEEAKLRNIELPNLTSIQRGEVTRGQLDAAESDAMSRIMNSLKTRLVGM